MTATPQAAGAVELLTSLSSVRTSPKWSFRGKPASAKKQSTPGPGQYQGHLSLDLSLVKASNSHNSGFGSNSPRELYKPTAAPGPGAYSPTNPAQVSTRCSFGRSQRPSAKTKALTSPGPGAYAQKKVMGWEGSKFTAAPRRELHRTSEVPGPGSYGPADSAVAEVGPKYGFATSPRSFRKKSHSPGPGAYSISTGTLKSSPRPTIGCRREAPRLSETPGPGEYSGATTTFGY